MSEAWSATIMDTQEIYTGQTWDLPRDLAGDLPCISDEQTSSVVEKTLIVVV